MNAQMNFNVLNIYLSVFIVMFHIYKFSKNCH